MSQPTLINNFITIIISPTTEENALGQVSMNMTTRHLVTLCEKSEYLKEIIQTFSSNDQTKNQPLFLLENNPCEAVAFIHELITPTGFLYTNTWRSEWVELSAKWIVLDYVKHFKEISKKVIDMTIHGYFEINHKSQYDKSEVKVIYKSKDLLSYVGNYPNYVVSFSNGCWICPNKSIYGGKGVHGIDKYVYTVGEQMKNIEWQPENKIIDLFLFCNVVSSILKHPCLVDENCLIKNKKDLIFAIIMTPILRCKLVYDNLLDNRDFFEMATMQL